MWVPASTRLPSQPWRSRSAASRRSANSPVLVAEVGAEAEQEAVVEHFAALIAPARPGVVRSASAAVVEPGRHDPDAPVLDERVGEQLAPRVIGEHDHPLGGREAVAAGAAIVLPGVGVGEVAGVAVRDQVELAEHEALAERQRERYIARRKRLLRAVEDRAARRGRVDRSPRGSRYRAARAAAQASRGRSARRGRAARSAQLAGVGEREDQLEDVDLGAGDGAVERARVERHPQPRARLPRRLEGEREHARVAEASPSRRYG